MLTTSERDSLADALDQSRQSTSDIPASQYQTIILRWAREPVHRPAMRTQVIEFLARGLQQSCANTRRGFALATGYSAAIQMAWRRLQGLAYNIADRPRDILASTSLILFSLSKSDQNTLDRLFRTVYGYSLAQIEQLGFLTLLQPGSIGLMYSPQSVINPLRMDYNGGFGFGAYGGPVRWARSVNIDDDYYDDYEDEYTYFVL
uniref:DUF1834 family protein n=1 Tax=Panagrellus redivivus TaxID=6233 RepID=A0A7E4VXD7_PANRE